MALTKPREIIKSGTRAAQPAATAVAEGTVYLVTDEFTLERSNGASWATYAAGWTTGSFAPAVSYAGDATGVTYSTQDGRYGRVGHITYITLQIIMTAKGTGTGQVRIGGFPFTVANAPAYGSLAVGYWSNWNAAMVSPPLLYVVVATTYCLLYKNGAGGVVNATDADTTATTTLSASGFYLAA